MSATHPLPAPRRFPRSKHRRVAAVILGLILVAVLAVAIVLLTQPQRPTLFATNSVWNARLSLDAPIASDSRPLVAELERQISTYKTWINTYQFSTPVYTVSNTELRVPVVLDQSASSGSVAMLAKVFNAGVPIPTGAAAAPGTDKAMVIYQPSTDTMWELWLAHRANGAWHAMWGGRMDHVSSNPGYFTSPRDWGTAATSLALVGGLIRLSDLKARRIDHALAISIPEARSGVFAGPAQRTDGKLNEPNAIPEGTRFRLDPRLDVAKLHLPPLTEMLALAAQRYGLIVRDQSGVVAFYGQQSTRPGPDPYYGPRGYFHGLDPAHLTAAFPWSHLQVVAAPLHTEH